LAKLGTIKSSFSRDLQLTKTCPRSPTLSKRLLKYILFQCPNHQNCFITYNRGPEPAHADSAAHAADAVIVHGMKEGLFDVVQMS
jgi:hypothetical protein